ncbi:MAG: VOC family protein [Acidimicrobiia bacterium]|nr:VOC family protein [Acidimicrobiia bacterium]
MSAQAAPAPEGISHVATITADLDRLRAFYEGVLGMTCTAVMRMSEAPYLRHAFLAAGPGVVHVFEQPGYDPVADGIPNEIGRRGRVDHFGLMVADEVELAAVRDRLVDAGASEGVVTDFGSVLSVHFCDPDGLHAEVNCPNPAFDRRSQSSDEIEEEAEPDPTRAFSVAAR